MESTETRSDGRIEGAADLRGQLIYGKWLRQKCGAAIQDSVVQDSAAHVAGRIEHLDIRPLVLDPSGQRVAVHARHDDIGEEQLRRCAALEQLDRLLC